MTLDFGRDDPRLFDCMMDWVVDYQDKLSVHRLKTIMKGQSELIQQLLSAVATSVDTISSHPRWSALTRTSTAPPTNTQPLFVSSSGDDLPTIGEPDPVFLLHGFLRDRWQPRTQASYKANSEASSLIISLRCLFGISPRAEIIAFMLTQNAVRQKAIATASGYSIPSVQSILKDMVSSEYIYQASSGLYEIDKPRWSSFFRLDSRSLIWRSWTQLMTAIRIIDDFYAVSEAAKWSEYMQKSMALTVISQVRDILSGSGILHRFNEPCDLDHAPALLSICIDALLQELNPSHAVPLQSA